MMTQRRISPRSVLLTASLLVLIADTQAGAQRRPDRAKLPGFIESTWKPVRDGGAEVVAIEVRTELKGLPDSLRRSLSVNIPYVRGALYFADLDSKIRAYSGNKRHLDKVMFDVFQARERGEPFTHETWKQIVVRAAGPNARGRVRAYHSQGRNPAAGVGRIRPVLRATAGKVHVGRKRARDLRMGSRCEHSG